MKTESHPVGRPSLLRHTNALTILKLLREAGSCSRADLVRASGLSAPTVTNVVGDLLEADLIQPLGEGESSGGRPPDMISFKAERGCILAVQITAGVLFFLLSDLSGTELERSNVSLVNRTTTPEAICRLMANELRRLLKKQKKTPEKLLTLVVGVPAIANVEDGVVLSISTLKGWRSVPLRSLLSKVTDCHILIENDTNLAALGERHRGAARDEQTFILIDIGVNVSAGIVLNGQIHHGAQWSAGEIGYLRLPNVSRKQPSLYEFGELEDVLTCSGILKSWRQAAKGQGNRVSSASRRIDALAILNLAQAGDPLSRRIIKRRAVIMSDIVVNLSLILNPDLILLGGEIGKHPVLLNYVQKQLGLCEFAVPRIAAASLGEAAVLWGGVAVALEIIPSVLLPSQPHFGGNPGKLRKQNPVS